MITVVTARNSFLQLLTCFSPTQLYLHNLLFLFSKALNSCHWHGANTLKGHLQRADSALSFEQAAAPALVTGLIETSPSKL